jgi:hypothetical protein
MKIRINKQLQMLCEILGTTPQQVLQDFADNLSLDYQYTSGSDERMMAVQYFMRCGYGMHLFDYEEVEQMFDALNDIRYSFYNYGNPREEEYVNERNKRYREFYKQWKVLKEQKER